MSAHQKDTSLGIAVQNYNFFTSISVNTTMFFEFIVFFYEKIRVKRAFFTTFASFLY
jgi:hypothetical protein